MLQTSRYMVLLNLCVARRNGFIVRNYFCTELMETLCTLLK